MKGQQEVTVGVKGNVLYRIYKHVKVNGSKAVRQVIVPTPLRQQILVIAHESIMGGHMRSKKAAEKILSDFYRPEIRREISRFCPSCEV